MNTQIIRKTKVKKLPYLPPLTGSKTTRVVTKHFTNCSLYLPEREFTMLCWLIYQSRQDNTITYSTHLLSKYRESLLAAWSEYGDKKDIPISIQIIRLSFKKLIEEGYLLPNYSADVFTLNPMITYRHEYIRKDEYSEIAKMYQAVQFGTGGDVRDIGKSLSEIVNKRIKDKKK